MSITSLNTHEGSGIIIPIGQGRILRPREVWKHIQAVKITEIRTVGRLVPNPVPTLLEAPVLGDPARTPTQLFLFPPGLSSPLSP